MTTIELAPQVTYCLPQCGGHLGKYDNCLTEALHEQCSGMVGWSDEESGDCDSPYGYFWLILGHDSIEVPAADWSGGWDVRTVPGTFLLIRSNDQGHVWLQSFDTAEEAQAEFDTLDTLYGVWSEANEY